MKQIRWRDAGVGARALSLVGPDEVFGEFHSYRIVMQGVEARELKSARCGGGW